MSIHKSVLLVEAIDSLNLKEGATVVDATLGGGGYSREILKRIGERGRLIAIDADREAIKNFKIKIEQENFKNRIDLINDNFSNLKNILAELQIEKVDAIVADLGWSTDQLVGKGMSFLKDEPLDMRFNIDDEINAQEIVNRYSEEKLRKIIQNYGEERYAKLIAHKIIKKREEKQIKTTKELVTVIREAVPMKYRNAKISPATRTFQALRIEVNQELENLEKFIPEAIKLLKKTARLAIVSFHSLEDRITKNIFRENARGCICPKNFPVCICGEKPIVEIINTKPIIPKEKERLENPKSRSAKLRVCEKI